MQGKTVQVTWAASDDVASLKRAYQQEQDAVVEPRLHLLWLVRSGKQVIEAAELVGVHNRTAQHWMAWYRDGGLETLRTRKKGGVGKESRLDAEQKAALVAKAREDGFVSIGQGGDVGARAVRYRLHALGDDQVVLLPAAPQEGAASAQRQGDR